MAQSEELMHGITFGKFTVDMDGFESWSEKIKEKHTQSAQELADLGLLNMNSTKEVRTWMEGMGIDCSRGTGKEVYENPVNVQSHPVEMGALAKAKNLETLRRKIKGFVESLD